MTFDWLLFKQAFAFRCLFSYYKAKLNTHNHWNLNKEWKLSAQKKSQISYDINFIFTIRKCNNIRIYSQSSQYCLHIHF